MIPQPILICFIVLIASVVIIALMVIYHDWNADRKFKKMMIDIKKRNLQNLGKHKKENK